MFDFNVNEKTRTSIRLRRASDNQERDFSLEDIERGDAKKWVDGNRFSLSTLFDMPANVIRWCFDKINQNPPNGA